MFSEWSFDSSLGSLVVLLFMTGVMVSFGTVLYLLLSSIFEEDGPVATTLINRDRPEHPFREAA